MFVKIYKTLNIVFVYIIDFIFPPSDNELYIRNSTYIEFIKKVSEAPETPYNFIKSILAYKNPLVRELIWQIKYKKNKKAIEIGGKVLYDFLLKYNYKKIILIPIPISNKRLRERGYNQCEILIDEIIKNDKDNIFIKNTDILKRDIHRDRQTLKNRKQRIIESQNIFSITPNKDLLNEKIIIIDDVVTTGSTTKQAYDLFIKHGYRYVEVLSLAR